METRSRRPRSLAFAAPVFASAGEHLIPAGSLISCTVAEPRISSKTTAVGDPVLCQVGHAEKYGRSVLPEDSYLVGRFEDAGIPYYVRFALSPEPDIVVADFVAVKSVRHDRRRD